MQQCRLFYRHAALSAVLLLSLGLGETAHAQKPGSLIVNPKRIVFEGQQRNDMVTLISTGSDSMTYQISMVQMQMDENGTITEIDSAHLDPKELYADKLVRFFPKQVTLGPSQSQTIRLQLLKPSNLAPGEYRSFLYFRPVKRAREIKALADTSKRMHLDVTTVFGIAIPIIVRHATTPAVASLGGMKIGFDPKTKLSTVDATLYRSGTQSLYGMLIAKWVNARGVETVLSVAKGVAVYYPNTLRKFSLPLDVPKGMTLTNGKLIVEYQTYSPEATKETVQASSELKLN